MLTNLIQLYAHYPEVLLSVRGMTRQSLSPSILEQLDDHGERQREILQQAQSYQIDGPAAQMLRALSAQMQSDGLDSMFSSVRLPFPAMFLTLPETTDRLSTAALVTQDGDALYTQVYHANKDGMFPNLLIFRSQGTSVDVWHSPTLKLAHALGDQITDETAIEHEQSVCFEYLSLAVGMSVLFEHKAMLEKDERPVFSRAERRRAQKAGRPLPNHSLIKVRLGELGEQQVLAAQYKLKDDGDAAAKRRTHWVQGHFMRNRAGGISWRNPHLRGAGPLLEQERQVSFDE